MLTRGDDIASGACQGMDAIAATDRAIVPAASTINPAYAYQRVPRLGGLLRCRFLATSRTIAVVRNGRVTFVRIYV
jgi:hypothetical protein